MRILVVEDDAVLSEAITHRVKALGHAVDLATSGSQAGQALQQLEYDLILLDLNLPDISGEQILSQLRQRKVSTPVLVVTARHEVDDRIQLLDLGADDYITKPFDFGELEARIRALLRRSQGQADDSLQFGNVCFEHKKCAIRIDQQEYELKQREFRLLEIFMGHPTQVLSKEVLMNHLYSFEESPGPNVIEIYVARLRKVLCNSNLQIRTIRGLGYLLEKQHG